MIREMREARGMSQGDLARLLNVDRSAVTRWESGEAKPCRKHRRALCQVFGVDEAALFPQRE